MTQKRDNWCLFALWLAATAYNLTKPYHMDDAAHLLIAQWIAVHPLHPMRGLLNWTGTPEPIAATNQPHLYFYALAGWGRLFGFSEIAMHTLQSCFTGAAIWLMYRLAKRVAPDHAMFLTALLALNPAFFDEQNLMVDVPLLSLWLAFFVTLLETRFALAGLACAAAILTKYSSLCLLPLLALAPLLARRPAALLNLLTPLAAIAAWSAFNWWDYGGIHILADVPRSGSSQEMPMHFFSLHRLTLRACAWALTAGALCPFGISALIQRRLIAEHAYPICAAGFLLLVTGVACHLIPDQTSDALLFIGFAINGAALLLLLRLPGDTGGRLLWLWIILTTGFYIAFAPFIAARHFLLILPPLTLLAARTLQPTRPARIFALGLSALLSLGLGLSDYRTAAFFQQQAAAIPASMPGVPLIAAGHWGWQYYATRQGMREIDVLNPPPAGSILAVPIEGDSNLPPGLRLQRRETITANLAGLGPFCAGRPDRLYVSGVFTGPWSLSARCAQHIGIFLVQ